MQSKPLRSQWLWPKKFCSIGRREDNSSLEIMKTVMRMLSNRLECRPPEVPIDDFEARYKLGLSFETPKFNVRLIQSDHTGKLTSVQIGLGFFQWTTPCLYFVLFDWTSCDCEAFPRWAYAFLQG